MLIHFGTLWKTNLTVRMRARWQILELPGKQTCPETYKRRNWFLLSSLKSHSAFGDCIEGRFAKSSLRGARWSIQELEFSEWYITYHIPQLKTEVLKLSMHTFKTPALDGLNVKENTDPKFCNKTHVSKRTRVHGNKYSISEPGYFTKMNLSGFIWQAWYLFQINIVGDGESAKMCLSGVS